MKTRQEILLAEAQRLRTAIEVERHAHRNGWSIVVRDDDTHTVYFAGVEIQSVIPTKDPTLWESIQTVMKQSASGKYAVNCYERALEKCLQNNNSPSFDVFSEDGTRLTSIYADYCNSDDGKFHRAKKVSFYDRERTLQRDNHLKDAKIADETLVRVVSAGFKDHPIRGTFPYQEPTKPTPTHDTTDTH